MSAAREDLQRADDARATLDHLRDDDEVGCWSWGLNHGVESDTNRVWTRIGYLFYRAFMESVTFLDSHDIVSQNTKGCLFQNPAKSGQAGGGRHCERHPGASTSVESIL